MVLILLLQVQQREIDILQKAINTGGASNRLVELENEVTKLRTENMNMYSLLAENKQLRDQLENTTKHVKAEWVVGGGGVGASPF